MALCTRGVSGRDAMGCAWCDDRWYLAGVQLGGCAQGRVLGPSRRCFSAVTRGAPLLKALSEEDPPCRLKPVTCT